MNVQLSIVVYLSSKLYDLTYFFLNDDMIEKSVYMNKNDLRDENIQHKDQI